MASRNDFHLRTAVQSDVDALEQLIERSVRGLSGGLYSHEQIESALRFVFGVDTRLVDGLSYFVVEREGKIVAAGGWSRWRTLFGADRFKRDADDELDPLSEAARIRAFFVDPEWTRRGLGRLLFDTCERAALDAGFRSLELMATLPGEPLYVSLGFRARERIEITLADGARLPLVRMTRGIGGG